ncbi:MAG TPA: hypothetical protein VGF07_03055 [Stellaceae bacterium]
MAPSDGTGELRVGRSEIARMARAAETVRDCRRRLSGGGILGEVTAGTAICHDWRRYPDGEVYDPASHAQYFYHQHPAVERAAGEHGHFHAFLRAEGMPPGVSPLVLPEIGVADPARPPQAAPARRGGRDEISHLVAVVLDHRGEPVRLFTTNRWVTGETWYPAADVIRMLDRFTFAEMTPAPLTSCWLSALIQLFRPQVAALLQTRDETVMAWRRRRRGNVFEDPRLEITSAIEIDLDAQLAFVAQTSSGAAPRGRSRLPNLAEGWGEDRAD